MKKSLIILLADGFEEVECTLPYDLCRRAGIAVSLVAVPVGVGSSGLVVNGSHGLRLQADCNLAAFLQEFAQKERTTDAVFLPGGMPGSKNLAENAELRRFLVQYADTLETEDRYLAAICAAPALVLGQATQILQARQYTCYPGLEQAVPPAIGAQKQAQQLVEDRRILTADGLGSAHLLAERLIQRLVGTAAADSVMQAVLYRPAGERRNQ